MRTKEKEKKIRWKIIDVRVPPYARGPGGAPRHYHYELWSDQGGMTMSSIGAGDIETLVRAFGIRSHQDLAGKTFLSQRRDASGALNLLVVEMRHWLEGRKYAPPEKEALWTRAAAALAEEREPDFSDVDDETIMKAFLAAFDGFSIDPAWFERFCGLVAEVSGGRVRLTEVEPKGYFQCQVQGPAAYLRLWGRKHRRVIFGPYSNPFTFET